MCYQLVGIGKNIFISATSIIMWTYVYFVFSLFGIYLLVYMFFDPLANSNNKHTMGVLILLLKKIVNVHLFKFYISFTLILSKF